MSLMGHLRRILPDRHPVRLFWHWVKALTAAARYGFPARKLTVIGITGTDGKTTTVAMTAHILHAAGIRTGAVSTSFYRIGNATENNPTHKTSLNPFVLQRFLRRCVTEQCTHVVVEASSHGLVQHRNDFLWPSVTAITNTSPEHLDYHGTMEQYRKDKGILFRMLNGKGTKVLNAEDATAELYARIPSSWTMSYSVSRSFGPPPGDHTCAIWAEQIAVRPDGTRATMHCNTEEGPWTLELGILGAFNVDNALCAISCTRACGIPLSRAVSALKDFPGVPGRMERIDIGQGFDVIVDFTVTPLAYEKTLQSVRKSLQPGGKLLVLTGSCGNRMREKRPMIGKIVSELADVVVVTEDETITEDPQRTIDDVWAGIDQSACDARKILHRREAMAWLLKEARPGDAVLLCGMGACTTMQTKDGLRPWDERAVAREILSLSDQKA